MIQACVASISSLEGLPTIGPWARICQAQFNEGLSWNIFTPSVAPFTLWVRHAWVDGPMGWQFNILGLTDQKEDDAYCAHPWQVVKQLWCTTRVVLRLDFSPDRSVASSFVHFLYIYHTPPFSFLHFQLKHIARALPSTLSESNPFNTCTCHQLNRRISLIHRFGEYFLFTSPAIVLFIFLDFYTHPSALLDPSVLGFVVTCR